MSSLTPAQRTVNEETSFIYTCTLVNEAGTAIAASTLNSMTLTLYDKDTGDIINGRSKQDVLNTNNVTVDANGLLTWSGVGDDNVIVTEDSEVSVEVHVALFEWRWNTTRKGNHDIEIIVRRMPKIPTV